MKKDLKTSKALTAFNKKYNISITVDKNMPDFSKDPVFRAKHEKAEKFLAEHGTPESFRKKSKAKGVKPKTFR